MKEPIKCISIKQPWASMIALGLKHEEYRSQPYKVRGRVRIVASEKWFSSDLKKLVREHFESHCHQTFSKRGLPLTASAKETLDTFFPISTPVADAVITDCIETGDKRFPFALVLQDVRIIILGYKPVLHGADSVPWLLKDGERGNNLREALEAFAEARPLSSWQETYSRTLIFRDKIDAWVRDNKGNYPPALILRDQLNAWLRDNKKKKYFPTLRDEINAWLKANNLAQLVMQAQMPLFDKKGGE